MREKWFRFVPHSRFAAYYAAGWRFSAYLGLPHSEYACLMEWPHDTDPREPEDEVAE